jgi:conjugal transfer/entry exclusion protein
MVAHIGRIGRAALTMVAFMFLTPIASADAERVMTLVADAALSTHLTAVDDALARHDMLSASRELQASYQAALASRRWQAMIAYGDAALRVADAAGTRQHGMEQARRAYLLALYRARSERSVDGALAATQSFMLLGDRDAAQAGLSMARGLARTAAERDRVGTLAARLEGRLATIPRF